MYVLVLNYVLATYVDKDCEELGNVGYLRGFVAPTTVVYKRIIKVNGFLRQGLERFIFVE